MSVPMPLVPLAVASDVPVLKANCLLQAVFSTLKSYCIENKQTKTKTKQLRSHLEHSLFYFSTVLQAESLSWFHIYKHISLLLMSEL